MLNTLFATNISSNSYSRKLKDLSECSGHYWENKHTSMSGFTTLHINANSFYCIDNSKDPNTNIKYFYGIFAEGLTIEGQDADGNYFEPVSNSFASSLSLIKITATTDCDAELFWMAFKPASQEIVEKVAFVFKRNWESRIKTTVEGSNTVMYGVVIPNSNNPSVTIIPENGATASYSKSDMKSKRTTTEVTIDDSFIVTANSYNQRGSVFVKSSAPTWSYCPDKVILYEDEKIYSEATPDYVIPGNEGLNEGDDSSTGNDGLSTGVIFGIVIAVIAIIAVAVALLASLYLKKEIPHTIQMQNPQKYY